MPAYTDTERGLIRACAAIGETSGRTALALRLLALLPDNPSPQPGPEVTDHPPNPPERHTAATDKETR